MKRIHIHIAVNTLSDSIQFYSTMFGTPPSVERQDYAKWRLDDPVVNFSISQRGHSPGLNHLGIQVDTEEELKQIAQQLQAAETDLAIQEDASCCYARSNKHWTRDPQGIAWETFHTLETIPVFGQDTLTDGENAPSACCIPLHGTHSVTDRSANCFSDQDMAEK